MSARNLTAFIGGILIMLFIVVCTAKQAKAHGPQSHNNGEIVNNFYAGDLVEVTDVSETTIITGVSEKELAKGIAAAIAAGGHQFDLGTEKWQASVSAAFEADENVDAVSFGVGKVFGGVDALFSGSFTRTGDLDIFQAAATWRF